MTTIKIRVTQELLTLFREHRLATAAAGERLRPGDLMGLDPETTVEKYAHLMEGNMLPLVLGAFSYSHSVFNPELELGRYCSLSWGVEVIPANHPTTWASTSTFSYYPFDHPAFGTYLDDVGNEEFRLHRLDHGQRRTIVGNDVWIGMRVLLKRGIRIGDGAVVGAGSVVTHDVPPYAIVAGSPARVVRYRFGQDIIARLLETRWWRFGPDQVQPLDVREPAAFLDRLEERIAAGMPALDLPRLTGERILAAAEPWA